MSFEKHSETLQGTRFLLPRLSARLDHLPLEIIKFREMLEDRNAKRAVALTAIPDEYKPVIAKLVHERYPLFWCRPRP
jgi:hypothetical protein